MGSPWRPNLPRYLSVPSWQTPTLLSIVRNIWDRACVFRLLPLQGFPRSCFIKEVQRLIKLDWLALIFDLLTWSLRDDDQMFVVLLPTRITLSKKVMMLLNTDLNYELMDRLIYFCKTQFLQEPNCHKSVMKKKTTTKNQWKHNRENIQILFEPVCGLIIKRSIKG